MGSIIGDEEIQEIEGYGGSGGSSAIGWGGRGLLPSVFNGASSLFPREI